jgi:hypothetical protein
MSSKSVRIHRRGRVRDDLRGELGNLPAAEEHLALVGEVPENGPRGEASPGRDLRHGRRGEPLRGEQVRPDQQRG